MTTLVLESTSHITQVITGRIGRWLCAMHLHDWSFWRRDEKITAKGKQYIIIEKQYKECIRPNCRLTVARKL